MSLRPQDQQAIPLGGNVGRAANGYAEPSGVYVAEILRRFVQFIDAGDWRDERAKVFDVLLTLSFGAGRSAARLPEQALLRELTGGLGETVISRAVRDLEKTLGILTHWRVKKDAGAHRDSRTGGMMYQIEPDPANWRVRWRLDAGERKLAIDKWAWVYRLNLHPEAPGLPLPSDVPGLADALRELARDAVLTHPLSAQDFPPRSSCSSGRTSGGHQTPDNQQRLCRQPLIGNEPAAGVREADAPAVGPAGEPTAADPSGATTPTPSDTAGLPAPTPPTGEDLAVADAEIRRLQKAAQGGHLPASKLAEEVAKLRRRLGLEPAVPDPGEVSSPAKSPVSKLAESGGSKLAGELSPLAYAGASDASEHLHPEHPVSGKAEIYLSSPPHPDEADECRRHQGKADEAAAGQPKPGDYTGNLVADLIRAMGAEPYAKYRGAWDAYVACDRRGVIETLLDYSLARKDPHRRKEVANAGPWMGRVFRIRSRKWQERQRQTHPRSK